MSSLPKAPLLFSPDCLSSDKFASYSSVVVLVNKSKSMGLLDKLWDDTVAGPRPDSGLSKLRKHSTFSFRTSKEEAGESADVAPKVTMSIMIKRPTGCPSPVNGTPPTSPAGSTPPVSPFAGGGKEWNRFRRKSSSDVYERAGGVVGPRSPPPPFEVGSLVGGVGGRFMYQIVKASYYFASCFDINAPHDKEG